MADILAEIKNNLIELKFEYDPALVARVRNLPGRHWNADRKIWTIPLTSMDSLKNEFADELSWSSSNTQYTNTLNISVDTSISTKMKVQPYPYQWLGANFLMQKKRAMIADEMGLGKTMQAIVAFRMLKEKDPKARAVIFTPASLKFQWAGEIERFTDMNAVVVHGDSGARDEIYKQISYDKSIDIVIINYELMYYDYMTITELVNTMCNVMILDEAQKVKNWDAQISKMFKGKKATKKDPSEYAGLRSEYIWLLTGTPLENSPDELFNLFSLIDPEILGNYWAFRKNHIVLGRFNQQIGVKYKDRIHAKIAPYMLRRKVSEVEQNFPEVRYDDILLDMEPFQARCHELIREDMLDMMSKGDTSDDVIMGRLALLAMVANSPELLTLSESKFARKLIKELKPPMKELTKSPKLDWIEDYVKEMLSNDAKAQVVVFSRSEKFCRLILERLKKHGEVRMLSGSMDAEERELSKQSFVRGEAIAFVSTEAGSRGLNLQCAGSLINADIPWNPATLAQRNGRIIRLGSSHDHVRIINLCSRDSIDERIRRVIYDKSALADQIIEKTDEEAGEITRLSRSITAELLRRKRK
jgi:SNF2 family DNA or RNA helicase